MDDSKYSNDTLRSSNRERLSSRIILGLIIILLVLTCNNDPKVIPTNAEITPGDTVENYFCDEEIHPNDTINLKAYFPLEIGNRWMYYNQSGELALLVRTIVDTVRRDDGLLFYKASLGVAGSPQNEMSYEYYCWGDCGLFMYSCGIEDTCRDDMGNELPPVYRMLLKSDTHDGALWHGWPEGWNTYTETQVRIIDSLHITNTGWSMIFDTTLYNVAHVISITSYGTNPTTISNEYYAKNIGLIKSFVNPEDGFESTQDLLDFSPAH